MNREQILLGGHTVKELERLLRTASHIGNDGERIQFLSGHLLGTGYADSTLVGNHKTREIFVINLEQIDCMTFVEYIEAMRVSSSFPEFIGNMKKVRYKSGVVDFHARNHFFTDWKEFNANLIEDVTERVGGRGTVHIHKRLNEKEDGTCFLPAIQPVIREIIYMPSESVDSEVINNLMTGDYIGIFSHLQGLDVSHAGIMVRQEGFAYFRHASSHPEQMRVIDQDFRDYIAGTPGIVVFRPKKQQ
jgi:hypothetical protein